MKVPNGKILFITSVLLLSGLTACKCGSEKQVENDHKAATPLDTMVKDYESTVEKLGKAGQINILGLIPSDVDLALIGRNPNRFYSWLKDKPWWTEVKSSPVWQDLYLSPPIARLSSIRHRLASLSPVRFKIPTVEEFLSTPIGLAVKKSEEGSSVLLVKQIDLRIQALDRLAEVFNQIKDEDTAKVQTIDGIKLRSVDLGTNQSLHYVVFSNLLLVSDDEKMIQDSLALAKGKAGKKSLAEGEHDTLFASLQQADLELILKPEKYPLVALFAPVSMMAIGWSKDRPDSMDLAAVANNVLGTSNFQKSDKLLSMLPLDSRMVFARTGFDASKTWQKVISSLHGKTKRRLVSSVGNLGKVLEKIDGKMVLDLVEMNPLEPAVVVLMELKKQKLDSTWLQKELAGEIEFATGKKAEKSDSGEFQGLAMWSAKSGTLSPSFAVTDQWLILGSTKNALVRVLKTMAGKSPSLMDKERLGASMAPDDATVGMYFISFDTIFRDLVKNSKKIISSSERFDTNDLVSTWIPFFEALEKMSCLGGSWSVQGPILKGRLISL